MKKKVRLTVREALELLERDPAYRARRAQQDKAVREREAFYAKAERPLVSALGQKGLAISSVWDLVNSVVDYDHVIPLLLEHFQLPYPARVREGIARAMAVPAAAAIWESLLTLFLAEQDGSGPEGEVKWGLACALDVAFTEAHKAKLLQLVGDPRHGRHRNAFLGRVAQLPREESIPLLTALAADDTTKFEAARLLKRLSRRQK